MKLIQKGKVQTQIIDGPTSAFLWLLEGESSLNTAVYYFRKLTQPLYQGIDFISYKMMTKCYTIQGEGWELQGVAQCLEVKDQ